VSFAIGSVVGFSDVAEDVVASRAWTASTIVSAAGERSSSGETFFDNEGPATGTLSAEVS
jgi:hypothetical protein